MERLDQDAAEGRGGVAAARLTAWLRPISDCVTDKRPVAVELLEHAARDRALAVAAPACAPPRRAEII